MKNYSVRISYTDRKFGPGNGSTTQVKASAFHTAIKLAVKRFWQDTTHKQHNDIRRGGLKVEIRELGCSDGKTSDLS